jgi:hypothetical protein
MTKKLLFPKFSFGINTLTSHEVLRVHDSWEINQIKHAITPYCSY